jgi:hypothetical protein
VTACALYATSNKATNVAVHRQQLSAKSSPDCLYRGHGMTKPGSELLAPLIMQIAIMPDLGR